MTDTEKARALDFLIELLEQESQVLVGQRAADAVSKDVQKSTQPNLGRRIKSSLMRFIPQRIKGTAKYFLSYQDPRVQNQRAQFHDVFLMEKEFAIDFLNFILKEDPKIPFQLFPSEDWPVIEQYVRNKVLVAIYNQLPYERIFDKHDLKEQERYQIFIKDNPIVQRKGYYEHCGFKSVVPPLVYETAIFVEHYGLNYLSSRDRLEGSVAVDCGAYVGDSTFLLNRLVRFEKIVAVEPDPENHSILSKNIQLNALENVLPLQKGVGETRQKVRLAYTGAVDTRISGSSDPKGAWVEIDTLDCIVEDCRLDKVGLVKMDVEGAEYEAIRGAARTMRRFKPVLLICLYHKGQHFFKLPELIRTIEPSYKFRFLNIDHREPSVDRILLAET